MSNSASDIRECSDFWERVADSGWFDVEHLMETKPSSCMMWLENNDDYPTHLFLYAKMGIHKYNMIHGTNLELYCLDKYVDIPKVFYRSYYITLVTKDPAGGGSLALFQTDVVEERCDMKKLIWDIARPKPEPQENPMQTLNNPGRVDNSKELRFPDEWPSEIVFTDNNRYYVVKESELRKYKWIRLYLKLAFLKANTKLENPDLSKLVIVRVVVETKDVIFEDLFCFVSETFEDSFGLSLEIEDVHNISSALELFTRVEKLEEQLTCDNCKETVSKEKQFLLNKLPLVATFHLKRFRKNRDVIEKICKAVNIPFKLDLKPYMRNGQHNEVRTNFYLYAFVEHVGTSLDFGHYISFVRSAPKIWHKFDDAKVTRIDEDSVQAENSYILFYAREGTPLFEERQRFLEASLLHSSPKSVLEPTDRECVPEISYGNKLCDSVGVTNPHVKTDEHCVSLSNETDEDVILSPKRSGEDSFMVEPRLDIDRVTNGDKPDDLFNVHSPKMQDDSTGVSNPHVKTDEHFVSLPNETNEDVLLSPECTGKDSSMAEVTDEQDSTLKLEECSLEARAYASSMAELRLDIDRVTNDDEPYDLFNVLSPKVQGRIKNVFEKLRKCKLEDDKDKWDAERELQKEEKRKKREAEEKRREELRKKKDKGRKKGGVVSDKNGKVTKTKK